ncbi:sulfatase [Poriferisphaera sp. WC338]|uniref:sulfatase n=1 Tax=Poriferisphaera sp. WC338 TaxID=3425129 RepID=UPI003D8191CB
MPVNSVRYLCALSACLPIASLHTSPLLAQTRPNIILIVADDMGSADLSCLDSPDIQTPNIDQLAANGVRFTNAYTTAAVCSPSRAALYTGRYQQSFGYEFNLPHNLPDDPMYGIPLSLTTLPEQLQSQNYTTALVGKYHLGMHEKQTPNNRGFDHFFGFLSGGHPYAVNARRSKLMHNNKSANTDQYLTDELGDQAANFINQNKTNPFYLMLSFNAPHTPMQATNEDLARFKHIEDESRRTYAAMVYSMDRAIGNVLQSLNKNNLTQNTMIIFLSDHGGATPMNTASNDPFRGNKSTLFEGGIRVPFIISYPGKLPVDVTYDHPISSLDIFPTALAAAGTPQSAINQQSFHGQNLLPYLIQQNKSQPHPTLYWRTGRSFAIRHGDWKLIKVKRSRTIALYNLTNDPSEQNNLSDKYPDKVRELQVMHDDWADTLIDPLWEEERHDTSRNRNSQRNNNASNNRRQRRNN